MSGPMNSRFEVVASTRRKFTAEQKEALLAEIEAGAPVSEVARLHSVSSSLLFRWRRDRAQSAWKSREAAESPRFLPVTIAAPAPNAVYASATTAEWSCHILVDGLGLPVTAAWLGRTSAPICKLAREILDFRRCSIRYKAELSGGASLSNMRQKTSSDDRQAITRNLATRVL